MSPELEARPNSDAKWLALIICGSLLLNFVQFIVIMCLWRGCPTP